MSGDRLKLCERCGNYYVIGTGKVFRRPIVSQGAFVDADYADGVCLACIRPGEMYERFDRVDGAS
jgi:hypothetical protein